MTRLLAVFLLVFLQSCTGKTVGKAECSCGETITATCSVETDADIEPPPIKQKQ